MDKTGLKTPSFFFGDIVLVIGSVMEKHLQLRVIESYSWEW